MEARDRDLALLHRAGVWPSNLQANVGDLEAGAVVVMGPPPESLGRLQWSGWDAIHAWPDAGAVALESMAAALPCLRRLGVKCSSSSANPFAGSTVEGMATVLQRYPVEDVHIWVHSYSPSEHTSSCSHSGR